MKTPPDNEKKPDRIIEPEKNNFRNNPEASINALAVAISVLPQLLDIFDEIADSLSFIRLYFEKRGLNEGIIAPDDIDGIGDKGPENIGNDKK